MKFTPAHIETLRREYATIETISVDEGSNGDKLMKFVHGLPTEMLRQLADAKIKFVSGLAQNEVNRRS